MPSKKPRNRNRAPLVRERKCDRKRTSANTVDVSHCESCVNSDTRHPYCGGRDYTFDPRSSVAGQIVIHGPMAPGETR